MSPVSRHIVASNDLYVNVCVLECTQSTSMNSRLVVARSTRRRLLLPHRGHVDPYERVTSASPAAVLGKQSSSDVDVPVHVCSDMTSIHLCYVSACPNSGSH